jgi:Fatty acid desaturase
MSRDPDIGGRANAFTRDQTRARRGIGSWLAGYQAWLFFPMLLEGFHLDAAGVRTLRLGGLNYQIEHHLFPSMPRPSLRHAQEPVRAFCAQHGIAYREAGFFASCAQVLRHLHTVGGSPRPELEY